MLTREQKAWIVAGFCNTFDGCDTDCPLHKPCASSLREFDDFTVEQLDECMKIIAPELVEEPKPVATPQWISVDDKLPDTFNTVIVCREYAKGSIKVEQGYRDVNGWWMIYGARVKRVTHWMPFPEPTEEDEHEEDQN